MAYLKQARNGIYILDDHWLGYNLTSEVYTILVFYRFLLVGLKVAHGFGICHFL